MGRFSRFTLLWSVICSAALATPFTDALAPVLERPGDRSAHVALGVALRTATAAERRAAATVLTALAESAVADFAKLDEDYRLGAADVNAFDTLFASLALATDDAALTDRVLVPLATLALRKLDRHGNLPARALAAALPLASRRGDGVYAPFRGWMTRQLFAVPAPVAAPLFEALAKCLSVRPEEIFLLAADKTKLREALVRQRSHWAPDRASIEAGLDGAYLKFMKVDPDVDGLAEDAFARGRQVDALVVVLEGTPDAPNPPPRHLHPVTEAAMVDALLPADVSATTVVRLVALFRRPGVIALPTLEGRAAPLARRLVLASLDAAQTWQVLDCLAALTAPPPRP